MSSVPTLPSRLASPRLVPAPLYTSLNPLARAALRKTRLPDATPGPSGAVRRGPLRPAGAATWAPSSALGQHRSNEVLGVVILDAGRPTPEGDDLLLDFAAAYGCGPAATWAPWGLSSLALRPLDSVGLPHHPAGPLNLRSRTMLSKNPHAPLPAAAASLNTQPVLPSPNPHICRHAYLRTMWAGVRTPPLLPTEYIRHPPPLLLPRIGLRMQA